MATLFCTFTLLPMVTPSATMVFWPKMQRPPMTAPGLMCAKCQIFVPSPMVAPGSMMAVGWAKKLMGGNDEIRMTNDENWDQDFSEAAALSKTRITSTPLRPSEVGVLRLL